jgi:TRAP-type C4-dicarboxylate transport system permease small subunit
MEMPSVKNVVGSTILLLLVAFIAAVLWNGDQRYLIGPDTDFYVMVSCVCLLPVFALGAIVYGIRKAYKVHKHATDQGD